MRGVIDDIIGLFFPGARISAQRNLSKRYGWGFKARRKFANDPVALFPFDIFQGKKDKRLLAIIYPKVKKIKGRIRIYDYIFYGNFGNKTTTILEYEYRGEELEFPIFSIQPKGAFSSVKDIFFKKIEPIIPTTPEFRDNYTIATNDTLELRQSLSANFLDEVGERPGWTYEGRDNVIIAYQTGIRVPTSEILQRLNGFEELVKLLEV